MKALNLHELEREPTERGAYKCARCHSSKLKKLSLLYLEGTATRNSFILGFYRSFKGSFVASTFGRRQSLLAQRSAPPRKKSLLIFGLLWLVICSAAALVALVATSSSGEEVLQWIAVLWIALLVGGIVWRSRNIATYNTKVLPRIHAQWERSYLCMQCGRVNVI